MICSGKKCLHSILSILIQGWFDITDARNREQLRYLFLFKGRLCITEVKKVKANRNIYLVKGVVKVRQYCERNVVFRSMIPL